MSLLRAIDKLHTFLTNLNQKFLSNNLRMTITPD